MNVGMLFTIRADANNAEAELKRFSDLVDKEAKSIEGSFSRTSISIGSLFGNLYTSAISSLTANLQDAGRAVFEYSSQLEQTKVGFTTLLGNADKANKLLKELQDFSKSTPFEFQGITSLAQRLLGANVESEKLIPLLKDIGNVVAATGDTSIERFEGISTAITQIISKGKVSAEEMEQLAERGIPAWKLLAEAIGKPVAETRKLAEQGVISSDVLVQALQKISREKYGDAMAKQSQVFAGATTVIKDSLLQTAATAFEPFYKEISAFAANFASKLQKQESPVKSISFEFGKTIGESIKKGYQSVSGNGLASFLFSSPLTELSIKTGIGIAEGLIKPVGISIADLRKLDDSIGQLKNSVKDVPSLALQLDAQKAAADAEKVRKAVSELFLDLTDKILFFGDSSEEAAVKQKLLKDGVVDFSDAQVQSVLSLARNIDKLKEAQKAQKDYNEEIQKNRKTIDDFVNKAFESFIPDQSELDRFNSWVRKTGADMGELRQEVAYTREFLKDVLSYKQLLEGLDRGGNAEQIIQNVTSGINYQNKTLTDLKKTLFDVASNLKLVQTEFFYLDKIGDTQTAFDITSETFADKSTAFLDAYKAQIESFATVMRDLDERSAKEGFTTVVDLIDAARNKNKEALDKILDSFREFLRSLETLDKDGKTVKLFTQDFQIDAFIAQILKLDNVVKQSQVKKGLQELDDLLKKLGISEQTKTDFEKLNDLLSNPEVTEGLIKRAEALGITVEALKQLILTAAEAKLATESAGDVEGGEKGKSTGFFDSLYGDLFGEDITKEIGNQADYIKGVYADLAGVAKNAIGQMIGATQDLLAQWILTGKVSGKVFAQIAASVIAGLVVQSAIKAIFEYAEGLAAAARYDLVSASGHFAAAKIYGTVAGVAAVAAIGLRAAIGDKFNDKAKSSFASQTSNNQNSSGSSSGRGGAQYSQYGDQRNVIDENRSRQENPQRIELFIKSNDSHIVNVVERNVSDRGSLHSLIVKTADA